MQGLDDDIEEALRRCDEQKDPAKRERCKERVISTRFKAMQLRIDGTAADHARLEAKIDDVAKKIDNVPTREEFKEQARSIQEIFTRKVNEAISGQANTMYLKDLENSIRESLIDFGKTVAKKTDLDKFATKDDLARVEKVMATKEDLKAFATKEDLKAFATKDDVKAEINKIDAKLDKRFDEIKELLGKQ